MSALEEDLSCPVCCDIFKDPVLLTCSHSICKGCLKTFWETKMSRECPVCKTKSSHEPIRNLHLKNICDHFSKEGHQSLREPLCSLHRSELKLYCEDDKQLVCLVCRDSKLHKKHNCSPIEEAAEECKETLKTTLKPLQTNLKNLNHVKLTCDKTAQHIKVQTQQTEKQIKQEFKKLHQFLRDEEAARIAALKEEEEQKSQMMKEKIKKMSRKISCLSDTVRVIEEEMKADDVTFLQKYKSMVERAQCTLQDPEELPQGALINVAKHLGNLKFRVWEKMKEIVQYTPVILDPNTADPQLVLSEDLTCVRYGRQGQLPPNNPERFKNGCVLGSEGFNSGEHCWDVEVNDSDCWYMGLLIESTSRNDAVSFWSKFWYIYNRHGKYYSRSYSDLRVEQKPKRIRVQLDWDRGKLTFTDPDNNIHLHTFAHTFTERMFPCFFVIGSSLKILPVKPAVMFS